MSVASSKLGLLIAQEWHSDEALVRRLREAGLVRQDASDDDLHTTFRKARDEDSALPLPGQREYNSPNERVRVFLAPFLSKKGRIGLCRSNPLSCKTTMVILGPAVDSRPDVAGGTVQSDKPVSWYSFEMGSLSSKCRLRMASFPSGV